MGWVWRDDVSGFGGNDSISGDVSGRPDVSRTGDGCSTRKVVRSQCRTEEVEPGKFIRKCEKTEEVFRSCVGKPGELVQSNTEHTEEDVTDQILKGSNHLTTSDNSSNPFDFPGLQSDMDAIGRSFFGGIDRFFQAAEEMRNGFFNVLDNDSTRSYDWKSSSSPSPSPSVRRGIPIEGSPRSEVLKESKSGEVDFDGLAKDV